MRWKRRDFRPAVPQALEARVVPSHGHWKSDHLSASGNRSAWINQDPAPAADSGPTIGVLGDSYSDEYAFYPPDRSQARNWVEILANTRGVDFGPFSTTSRGEPRNQGFANDWALSGIDSAGMLASEVPGLTALVAQGGIPFVSLYIGANDFYEPTVLHALAGGGSAPTDAITSLPNVLATAEANVSAAVDDVLAANPHVRVVVVTLPPVSFLPLSQDVSDNPSAANLISSIDQTISQYNGWLVDLAARNPRVALADFAAVSDQLTQEAAARGGSVQYGGSRLSVTRPGDSPTHLFLADKVHLGTVGQGMLANTIVAALDAKFSAGIAPLFPQSIVQFAQQVRGQVHHGNSMT